MGLMALTHNIMILRPIKLFRRTGRESVSSNPNAPHAAASGWSK